MSIPESIANAVVRASCEHGVPNSFSPLELTLFYGTSVLPMQIGRAAPAALALLAGRGWTVTYTDRRFRVETAGPEYDA